MSLLVKRSCRSVFGGEEPAYKRQRLIGEQLKEKREKLKQLQQTNIQERYFLKHELQATEKKWHKINTEIDHKLQQSQFQASKNGQKSNAIKTTNASFISVNNFLGKNQMTHTIFGEQETNDESFAMRNPQILQFPNVSSSIASNKNQYNSNHNLSNNSCVLPPSVANMSIIGDIKVEDSLLNMDIDLDLLATDFKPDVKLVQQWQPERRMMCNKICQMAFCLPLNMNTVNVHTNK